MLEVIYVVAAYALMSLAAGVPIALCLRGHGDGWASFLVDAVTHGLVLILLGVVASIWVGVAGVIVLAALWLGALVFAIVRRSGLPRFSRPRGRGWWLVGGWAVVLVLAALLRLRSDNFLPWVGDMGAYVNWANEYAHLGMFKATWPPVFPVFLSIGSYLFGPALTTAGMPLTGLLLIVVIARLLRQLRVGPWATLTIGLLVAVGVTPIWYSSFPASESLDAPLFIAWISTIIGALRADRARLPWWLVSGGLLMLTLGLLRGTGPLLLVPLFVLAVVAIAAADWRPFAYRIWLVFAASLLGALGSYWYGIQRIPNYYIATQVHDLVPGPIFDLLNRSGGFLPTPVNALVLLLIAVVVCGIGLFFARRKSALVRVTRAPRILGLLLGSALLLGLVADAVVNTEVWNILLRAGIWLAVLTVLLLIFLGRAKLEPEVTALVLFFGTTITIFVAVHTERLKLMRGHSFHLYWDRYLVSEVIPLMFVLAGIALSAAWGLGLGARAKALWGSSRRARRAIPAAVMVVLLGIVVVPTVPQIALVTRHAYMDGAYQFDRALIGLLPDKTTPILWSATAPLAAPGFFFPNTWMAFAKPMHRSFGYDVPNIGGRGNDFAPDETLTADMILDEAACADTDRVVVFETAVGGPALDKRVSSPDLKLEPLGTRTSAIDLLSQPPTNNDWTVARITVRAWLVTIDPAARRECVKG